VYGHINFKLCGNYRRGDRRVWYTFQISRSNKPEVEIWQTFKILYAKINVKRRQIAEILHSNRKSGSANRTAVSKFTPEVHKQPACAVQMLLTMAGNATKCSTFEVQYGKSTSTRMTAIRNFRATLTERVISRMRTN